jgi:SAM-dependent methyltransferase
MREKILLGNFDQLAKSYRKSRPHYSNKITKFLESIFDKDKNIFSLDLGSGTGIFSRQLAKISKQVIGIEVSKEMIKNAYKINNIKYINSSVNNLKINKKFDLITSASCFHWFDNIKIKEIIQSNLREGGYFFITYNSRNIEGDTFLTNVEKKIISFTNSFKNRVSSGSSEFVNKKIINFVKISKINGPIFFQFQHKEKFSLKRYLNVWDSSNEFRNKLGERNYSIFKDWLIEEFPSGGISARYINRCWLLQKKTN